jgi:hypothetical protein
MALVPLKGYREARLAQTKFARKTGLLLSKVKGLPLDTQMRQKRLDVDERVEGSRQCSCSRPPGPSRAVHPYAPNVAPPRYPRVRGRNVVVDVLAPHERSRTRGYRWRRNTRINVHLRLL